METQNTPTEDDQALQMVLEAQDKQNKAIATKNIEILRCTQRLDKIGGKQDYTYTIMEAFKAFGDEVNLTFLSQVIADHSLFAKARKTLIEKGLIVEIQVKNRKILKLVEAK